MPHPKGETTQLRPHLFIASDGALHDTRQVNWHSKPLRPNYSMHHSRINRVADYKATLRAGPYAWPGGYQLYLLLSDGEALCFTCGNKQARHVIASIQSNDRDGWQCVACDVNYEDTEMQCAHCYKPISAAYGGNDD